MRTLHQPIRVGVVPVETWTPANSAVATFRYVDIGAVDRDSKSIVGAADLSAADAPSRARQVLRRGDILVSTVRPNLNAVAVVPPELDGAIGSTGFAVLRSRPQRVYYRFLFYWVRTDDFVSDMMKKATGASYPAVSERTVLDSSMPMPPLSEQRRIANILDKADAIRRKRKEAIALTEELLRSAFLEMFGDPVTNPKGWPHATVDDLCSHIVDCPHTTPTYEGTSWPHPCVRTSDLQGGFFDWSTTRHVSTQEYNARIARLRPETGDVFYTREGERYGIAAILPTEVKACLGQRMMLLRANRTVATPEFLWASMNSRSVYRQATAEVGGSTSPHVNVKAIRRFLVTCPPLSEQQQFSRAYASATRARDAQLEACGAANSLFSALVQRAFRGELSGKDRPSSPQLALFDVKEAG